MPKLPTDVSGDALISALKKIGFIVTRQKGSHAILRNSSKGVRVVVPVHKRIKPGTLRQILHDAGLSVEDFIELL